MPGSRSPSHREPADQLGFEARFALRVGRLVTDRVGSVPLEYVILLAFVALGALGAVRALAKSVYGAADAQGNRVALLLGPADDQRWLHGLARDEQDHGSAAAWVAANVVQEPAPSISRSALNDIQKLPPAQVGAWWASLTQAQRDQVLREHAEQLRGLDGVPAAVRDQANRDTLSRELAVAMAERRALPESKGSVTSRGPPTGRQTQEAQRLDADRAKLDARIAQLEDIQKALAAAGPDALLLGYTTDQPGRDGNAIIALGNPDTARHTAVYVPGVDTVTSSIGGNDIGRVQRLRDAAVAADKGIPVDELSDDADKRNVSTIMWLGYDAPSVGASVLTDGRSHDGAGPLRQFVGGLRATHQGDDFHVTAVGHSYGSAVVAEAMRGGGLAVDDVIVAGSPGMHADNVSELTNDPRHIWVGASATDPVASAGSYGPALRVLDTLSLPINPLLRLNSLQDGVEGLHGPSPQNPEFGANEYTVQPGDHSSYWNEGSDSLLNQANIVLGKYSDVRTVHAQVPPNLP